MWPPRRNLSIELDSGSQWLNKPRFKFRVKCPFMDMGLLLLFLPGRTQLNSLFPIPGPACLRCSESTTAEKFFIPSLTFYCPVNRLWPADLPWPIITVQNVSLFAFIATKPTCTIWKTHLHEVGWYGNYGEEGFR